MDKASTRLPRDKMGEYDLVKHHYNRRSLVGPHSMLLRKKHPISYRKISGNCRTWEVDVSEMPTPDGESAYGEPVKLFQSEDLVVHLSRRRDSMPYFYRNLDADELHLISRGQMTYETDFGNLEVKEQDFVLIPKGVTYRVVFSGAQDTLRIIYESGPEIFLVPKEAIDEYYQMGKAALDPEKLVGPQLAGGAVPDGEFEVRVKYTGAFSDFLGEMSSIWYDHYPLDAEIIEGHVPVFKFGARDVERFPGTPAPFLGGAYLDSKNNVALTFHVAGGGGRGYRGTPVHRDVDVDELRYNSSGPAQGIFLFTPHGVDHGAGRGYTKMEKNRPQDKFDLGDVVSVYTVNPLKGTSISQRFAKPAAD
jgi:homogentisate 1,2-dioxygenase